MGKIFIASTEIYTLGYLPINSEHLFLAHDRDGNTATTGDQYIIEASGTMSLGGTLVATIDIPLSASTYGTYSNPELTFDYQEVYSGSDSETVWTGFKDAAIDLVPFDGTYYSTDMTYWLQGPNSNTFLTSLLAIEGFDVFANEPSGSHPGIQGIIDGADDDEVTVKVNPYGTTFYIDNHDGDTDTIRLKKDATIAISKTSGGGGDITLDIEGLDTDQLRLHRDGNDLYIYDISNPSNPKPIVLVKGQFTPGSDPVLSKITVSEDGGGIGGEGDPIELDGSEPTPTLTPEQQELLLNIADWIQNVWDDFQDWMALASPLILDLGGNSTIDLVSLADSHSRFDLTGDMFAERTGWVDASSGDGFLVWDRNSDGVINGISELFGNSRDQGFFELSAMDSNGDGEISNLDTNWANLQVWVDSNGDGYSSSNELFGLSDFDIISISLASTRVDQNANENFISDVSSFSYSDFSTGLVADAWFQYEAINTSFVGDYGLDPGALFLPSMRGYGGIADLTTAMSIDSGSGGLMELVQSIIVGKSICDLMSPATLLSDISEIMYCWAGVDGVISTSRGAYVDARSLEFLEKILGNPFLQGGYLPDPGIQAGKSLTYTFFEVQAAFTARLLIQAGGAELFSNAVTYDLASELPPENRTVTQATI